MRSQVALLVARRLGWTPLIFQNTPGDQGWTTRTGSFTLDGMHPDNEYLVIGLDDGEASKVALAWALAQARQRRLHARVVTVWNFDSRGFGSPLSPATVRERTAVRAEDAIKQALDGEAPPPLETRILEGRADEILCTEARGAVLLALGAPRVGRLRERTGQVLTSCIRHAPCPVTVIPHAIEDSGNGRHRASRFRPRS